MQTVRITPYTALSTDCDGCGHTYTLRSTDADGILIGDECPKCGYYTTRYQRGMEDTEPEYYDGLDDAYDAWLPPETRAYMYGE